MNINLGAPYEAMIKKLIEMGYASNKTEAIRQAIMNYFEKIKGEELELVVRGIKAEMQKSKKEYDLDEILEKYSD